MILLSGNGAAGADQRLARLDLEGVGVERELLGGSSSGPEVSSVRRLKHEVNHRALRSWQLELPSIGLKLLGVEPAAAKTEGTPVTICSDDVEGANPLAGAHLGSVEPVSIVVLEVAGAERVLQQAGNQLAVIDLTGNLPGATSGCLHGVRCGDVFPKCSRNADAVVSDYDVKAVPTCLVFRVDPAATGE
jgi:hypothetical protein